MYLRNIAGWLEIRSLAWICWYIVQDSVHKAEESLFKKKFVVFLILKHFKILFLKDLKLEFFGT